MDEEKEAEIMSCKKLPSEIMVEILSRLPVKSLLRFRCVCKSWCSLVSDPSFVKLHLNRATEINKNSNIFLSISEGELLYCIEDYETCDEAIELNSPFDSSPFTHVDTVGSCNGLLCIRDRNRNPYFETYEDTIYLWNPATGEHKKLPNVPRTLPSHYRNHYTCLGFGYNLTTEEYKVVLISCALNYGEEESSCSHVYVYTLGTDEWRQLRNFPTKRLNSSSMAFDSLFVNERLHWFMDLNSNLGEKSIISFDLADEEFRNLPLPDRRPGDEYCMTLGELGGCLSYSCVLVYNIVEIWVMKDYGVRESWTKQFIVDWPLVVGDNIDFCLDQVGVSKNGEILLNQDFEDLILYDHKTKKARDLMFRGIKPCTINRYAYHAYILACPFMWSLVSLSAESAKNGNGVERQ